MGGQSRDQTAIFYDDIFNAAVCLRWVRIRSLSFRYDRERERGDCWVAIVDD